MEKTNPATNPKSTPSAYAPFLKEEMVEVRKEVLEAAQNPLTWGSIPDLDQMTSLEDAGNQSVETGYSVGEDGSVSVAVKTPMPATTPQMWDWWFGWHGSEDARYKLWHPKAHLTAKWEDGRTDNCYIGRNSVIKEYIGENLLDALIQFKSPIDFGFSAASINQKDDAVYICARIGHPKFPVDFGYLVHQVRKTEAGTEMRSRFWLGGKYVSARNDNFLNKAAVQIMKTFQGLPKNFGQDMLLHCSEEMSHLASILPELYQAYAEDAADTISGKTIHRGDAHFEQAVLDTVWSKTPVDRRPASIYEPKTVEDVINIVRHAKKVGRRITITSGGHSFSANFLREDCMLIDMKHFNQFKVNTEEKTAVAGPGV